MAGIGCPEAGQHAAFADAFDFILHSRESVSGGVATAALRGLKPVVPEKFGAYLPA